jgi:hypothetical protein
MDRWAGDLYGDPCRECGFGFSMGFDDALEYVLEVPKLYSDLLSGASGREQHPDLSWSAGSYVCHVADNLRIWAERLAGSAGGVQAVAAYDENLLALARGYADVPLVASLWSLGRSADDYRDAVAQVVPGDTVLVHPERGEMFLVDVVRANAHDAFHHAWDLNRILAASS